MIPGEYYEIKEAGANDVLTCLQIKNCGYLMCLMCGV